MPVVTFRSFPNWGRFGNQIIQYGFLKTYCRRHGCVLQLPPWVGNQLFGTEDPAVTDLLADYLEPNQIDEHGIPPKGDELVGHNFNGYAQYHNSWYTPDERSYFRSLFPRNERMAAAIADLRSRGDTIVGLHFRRGDYGQSSFPIIPTSWYLAILTKIWPTLNNPVMFIASEDKSLVSEFSGFEPVTTESLGVELSAKPLRGYPYLNHDLRKREPLQMDFYPDWALLRECDVLLMPNSTFSMSAAMCGDPHTTWRADLDVGGFAPIDAWNVYPLLQQKVDNYPHLHGIATKQNEYWT